MRFERLRLTLVAVLLAAPALSACSSGSRSFIVLTLKTSGAAIPNVKQVVVKLVKEAGATDELTYPADITIDASGSNTLSVSFSEGETGRIDFDVEARNGTCLLGQGIAHQTITPKGIASVDVALTPAAGCNSDGGVDGPPEGGVPEGGVFEGCDLVSPACTDGQTCQVNCKANRNECTRGGNGEPGAVCTGNADCKPGTQCFDYGMLGCNVKVCLRFCNNGGDCATFGAGGGGPGSLCEGPILCPGFETAYHTCTFNCDPRLAAAPTRGGCPTTLACVALAGMDQVDCTCAGPTRTKNIGDSCTPGGADCKAGLVCNRMGSTTTCRAICRCDLANGSCTAANDCPGGTTCQPVTNSTLFGVCL
jgi:hypothetical protein